MDKKSKSYETLVTIIFDLSIYQHTYEKVENPFRC